MGTKKFISEQLEGIDQPIKKKGFFSKFFKKGKLRIIIINEDQSYREYFKSFPKNVMITIKDKSYLFLSETIINGKYPTLTYFFNNPLPIHLKYEKTEINSFDLKTDEQKLLISNQKETLLKNVLLDAEAISIGFHTKFLRGLYDQGGFTYKTLIIILIVVAVLVLVFLQVFGVVDVIGAISGTAQKIK